MAAETDDFDDRFEYTPQLPERCCATCAYCSYPTGTNCALRIKFAETRNDMRFITVEHCGVCKKWLSRKCSLMAKAAASFEEFKLRKETSGEECDTAELEEALAERKATNKMSALAYGMLEDAALSAFKRVRLELQPFPLMANLESIDDMGRVGEIVFSTCFWSVHHWISENKQFWENWTAEHGKRKFNMWRGCGNV